MAEPARPADTRKAVKPLPLEGIRVLDLSRVFAMPYCGAYLADLGAEVIKVETHHNAFVDTTRTLNGPYPDNEPGDRYWERAGTFNTLNRGKRSVTLDLRSEDALAVLKQLISVSDVVLENFTPRVMRRFALDYQHLRQLKPDLIMVSNTGYGHSGPWTDFGAMATALEPTHGTGAFMGYLDVDADGKSGPGAVPNKIANSFTDFLASWTAQLAVMAGLFHRARTGQGLWIDLAMYQVGVSFVGEGLLDFAFNGRRSRRIGNRHESWSPHGCYPCRGDDEWVVIAARDDGEWRQICAAMDSRQLADDGRFADAVARLQNQDALDEIIAGWSSAQSQYQVMELLQKRGVPAGPVLDGKGLLANPQFRARGYFETVDHPAATGLGRREYPSRGWRMSGNDVHIPKAAPLLGEDNHYVLAQMLGLAQSRINHLEQTGAVGESLEGAETPPAVPLDRQVELGWTVSYDRDYRPELDPPSA
jgi:crotonobetainyl-CoA:carnitine CoA-transferase CaiB-like acyl-CoA transferase